MLLFVIPLMNGVDGLRANDAHCIQVIAGGDVNPAEFQHLSLDCFDI